MMEGWVLVAFFGRHDIKPARRFRMYDRIGRLRSMMLFIFEIPSYACYFFNHLIAICPRIRKRSFLTI